MIDHAVIVAPEAKLLHVSMAKQSQYSARHYDVHKGIVNAAIGIFIKWRL